MKRSWWRQRRVCRRVGHDWGPWGGTARVRHRDCENCATRELRHGMDISRSWLDKRWFVRRTLFGRISEWHA